MTAKMLLELLRLAIDFAAKAFFETEAVAHLGYEHSHEFQKHRRAQSMLLWGVNLAEGWMMVHEVSFDEK